MIIDNFGTKLNGKMTELRKAFRLLAIAIGISSTVQAQDVTVVDATDGIPIEYVYVSVDNQSFLTTDEKGMVNVSKLGSADALLTFQHTGYRTLSIQKADLKLDEMNTIRLEASNININEVVVSAVKWEHKAESLPVQVEVLDQQLIAFQNPQTSADLIGQSNQVFIQKSQLGGGSPMIRGFATSRVLLVVDGVRMNTAIFRGGNIQNVLNVDPLSIQRTEIIFGPSSVMYGSDALGGVMNFTTLQPQFALTEGETRINANAMLRTATANNERTVHMDFNVATHNFSSYTSISSSFFDDLEIGSYGDEFYTRPTYQVRGDTSDFTANNPNPNQQIYSGYEQFNVMQKLKYRANENVTWELDYHYSRLSDVPRYDRLTQTRNGNLRFGEWYYGPQEWQMARLGYTFTEPVGIFDKLKFTGAWQQFTESRHDRNFNSDIRENRFETVNAYSANFDFQKFFTEKTHLYYGLESVYNQTGSESYAEDITTGARSDIQSRYPNGSTWSSHSAYATWIQDLGNRFTLTTGARYSQIIINADFRESVLPLPFTTSTLNTGALTGNFGIAKEYGSASRVYFNAGTGFRAPNIDDIGKFFELDNGSTVIPNPDLQPEYLYSAEIGIQQRVKESYEIEVVAYYSYLDNAVDRRPTTVNGQDSILVDGELLQVQSVQNVDGAFIYGVSASFGADITDHWNVKASANYTKGEAFDGEPWRHAAPFFSNVSVGYRYERFRAQAYVNYNGEISPENMAPSERDKNIYITDENGNSYAPSWYTVNLKGTFRINEYVEVNAGIENILDVRYRPYSSGITAPGRNFIVAVRAEL
ncbi:TonB-dependent receptor [Phaeocystidibacter luteus]|uniref:TonB-dependent receptor n=2 Tax=Phaeocystidibacter luteus TaxID=911197 RepID=A0A6N6RMC6_9FLAO|nr:TonB-dependent receptor [Phaeocystidibacter luteus]